MSESQTIVSEHLGGAVAAPVADDHKPLRGRAGYVRIVAALGVAGLAWMIPFFASIIVLVPARLDQIDSAHKSTDFAMVTVVGSIVALVANIVFGAFSDRTRSRFGARTPWIIAGSVLLAASWAALAAAPTFAILLVVWCLIQLFQNMYLAPVTAIIADRVAPRRRGRIAGFVGVATSVGQAAAAALGAALILHPSTGFLGLAAFPLVGGIAMALLAPDTTNRDVPKAKLTPKVFLEAFTFPRKARDFYWALSGRLMLVLGYFLVMNYQLYILTDYIKLSESEAAKIIALSGTVTLATGIVAGLLIGPLSDKIGRRKLPVIVSTVLIGVGAIIPFLYAHSWAMLAFAAIGGFAMGIYWAVDQALVIDVLPSKDTAAKDLGILNMANTGGQILAPAIAAAVIAGGGYRSLFPVCVVAVLIAAALIVPIRSSR
jgi:MFS family permease